METAIREVDIYSLASREMIANMIEIHANATPFDAGVYLSSCDKGYLEI